ncbi:MAG: hypothetical protein JWN44_4514 [Myxococcales bacterium]|nr:hypothetical protein [Myxococcales bacterium]
MVSQNARRGMTAAGVLFLVAAVAVTQDAALDKRAKFPAGDDVLYLPRPSALRALSVGHPELMADLVFVRGLVYFGTQLEQKGDYRWLENYLQTITELDPNWKTPYQWAGVATMYNGKAITNEMVQASNRFLELGVRQFPDDWELPFMLGCNYLFELKTTDPKQREEWNHLGGGWVRHSAIVGGAPPWVPLLAATIMRKEGQEEAALRHLEEVFVSTQDDKTREEVRNRLLSLHAKIDLARAERDRAAFETRWHATLPYGPADLFVAIGAPRPPRMDVRALSPLAVISDEERPTPSP